MRQRDAGGLGVEIFSIFVLELLGNQFQFAHFRSMERPCSRHNETRMNGGYVVPLLFASAFAGELNDGRHL